MGFSNFIKSRVHTKFTADASQHKATVKGLSREEKKRNKELVAALDAEGKAIDASMEKWLGVAAAVGGVGVAIGAAKVAFGEYAKDVNLKAASVGVDMDGLKKASHGLLTEMELLSFAGSVMNSDFEITQQQMEDSLGGMVALRNQTNDFKVIVQEVTKALVEGKSRGLEQFGVQVGVTGRGINVQRAAIERLRDETLKMGGAWKLSGDDIKIAGIQMENTFRNAKISFGKAVNDLAPLIEGMTELVGVIAKVAEGYANLSELINNFDRFAIEDNTGGLGEIGRLRDERAGLAGSTGAERAIDEKREKEIDRLIDGLLAQQQTRIQASAQDIAKSWRETWMQVQRDTAAREKTDAAKRQADWKTFISNGFEKLGEVSKDILEARKEIDRRRKRSQARRAKRDAAQARRESILVDLMTNADAGTNTAGFFPDTGPEGRQFSSATLEDDSRRFAPAGELPVAPSFGEDVFQQAYGNIQPITDATAALAGMELAQSTLTGAMTSGLDAMITGQKGFKEAIKDSVGESLRAWALSMAAQSAMSLGAAFVALGTPGMESKAPALFQSAAVYAGGALLAGAGARLLGAGGGADKAATPTDVSGGATSGGGNGNRTINLFVGEGFEDESQRARQARLRDAVDAADRDDGTGSTVSFN